MCLQLSDWLDSKPGLLGKKKKKKSSDALLLFCWQFCWHECKIIEDSAASCSTNIQHIQHQQRQQLGSFYVHPSYLCCAHTQTQQINCLGKFLFDIYRIKKEVLEKNFTMPVPGPSGQLIKMGGGRGGGEGALQNCRDIIQQYSNSALLLFTPLELFLFFSKKRLAFRRLLLRYVTT